MRVEASRAGQTRRTRFGCGVAVLTTLVVAAVGSLIAAAFFFVSSGSSQVTASFLRAQAGAVRWDPQQRLTVLLVGRSGDKPTDPAGSLTLATFDPISKSVRLLSIPPNLWVSIPGFGPGRLGDALADSGIREELLTVESVLRIPIPYYVVTAPNTMTQVTDALGGVTVHVNNPISVNGIRLRAGFRHLSGSGAVAFSHSSAGDPQGALTAMLRQQSVLFALEHQVYTAQTFFRIPGIISGLGGSVDTNFPYNQVVPLVHTLQAVPNGRMTGDALSYLNGSITGYDAQNGEVSLPNWPQIRLLAQAMVPRGDVRGLGPVTVVNGTGTPGGAVALAAWLRGDRVRVAGYQGGPTQGYAETRVVVPLTASARTVGLGTTVATLLQIPFARGPVPTTGPQVMVLMGRDYKDPTQQ